MSAHVIFVALIWLTVAGFWGWVVYRHFLPKRKPAMSPVDEVRLVDKFLSDHGIRAVAAREPDGTISIYGHPDDTQKLADLMKRLEAEAAQLTS